MITFKVRLLYNPMINRYLDSAAKSALLRTGVSNFVKDKLCSLVWNLKPCKANMSIIKESDIGLYTLELILINTETIFKFRNVAENACAVIFCAFLFGGFLQLFLLSSSIFLSFLANFFCAPFARSSESSYTSYVSPGGGGDILH